MSISETDSSECTGALFAQREITFKEAKEEMDFLIFMLNSLKTLKTKLKVNKCNKLRLSKTAGNFDENVTKVVIQNIGIALFQWAKNKDNPKQCDKQNVTKLFYSAGALLDVSAVFGEMDPDIGQMREYANRRATVLNICCAANPFEAQSEETFNQQANLNLKSTKENEGNSTEEELIIESSISGSFLDKPTSSNQWSHGNPMGKRVYDRDFIHSLRFIPVSLKRHKGLPSLEVVREQKILNTSGNIMDSYFSKLKIVVMKNNPLISQKILSMIIDVIDLKRNDWKSQPRGTFSNWSQLMNNGSIEQEFTSSQLVGAVGFSDDPAALEEITKAIDSGTSFGPPEFLLNLEQYLREGKKAITGVFEWIKNFSIDTWDLLFIRALVTAVIESCIDGNGTESRLNYSSLKHYAAVLKRYVQNGDDSELEVFFAVQNLATQRQHAQGLIQGIFETLYGCKVISKKGFESWMDNNDPLQQKDNFEALNSASFVTWFEETNEYESDQVLAFNNSLYNRSNFRNLY